MQLLETDEAGLFRYLESAKQELRIKLKPPKHEVSEIEDASSDKRDRPKRRSKNRRRRR